MTHDDSIKQKAIDEFPKPAKVFDEDDYATLERTETKWVLRRYQNGLVMTLVKPPQN